MNGSISEQQIKDLIYSQQVISNGRLASDFKKFDPKSYRILERPFVQLLIDDLIAGSWTTEELASKYGVEKEDVKSLLSPLMDSVAAFDGGYIPRRTVCDDLDGHHKQYRYSYIPIPIQARIFDPTLGFSLLDWSDFLNDSGYHSNDPDEIQKAAYLKNLASFWEIPEAKILNYFKSEQILFVDTVYGPFPVLINHALYKQIREKFTEGVNVLASKYRNRNLRGDYEYYRAFLTQGPGSIPDLQYGVVNLCDTLKYCRSHDLINEYKQFQEINRCLFKMITQNLDVDSIPPADAFPKKIIKKKQKFKMSWESSETNHSQRDTSNRNLEKNLTQKDSDSIKSKNSKCPRRVQKQPIHKETHPIEISKKCLTQEDSDTKISSIIPLLQSSDLKVQIMAIKELSYIENDKVLSVLHEVALEHTLPVAVYATDRISTFSLRRTPKVLADILHSAPLSNARVIAAQALSDLNNQTSVLSLEKGLFDNNTQVREACVQSLGVIGGPLAVKILKNHMATENTVVVREAIERILKQ